MSDTQKQTIINKKHHFYVSFIACMFYFLLPYVFAVQIMTWLKTTNGVLVQFYIYFSLIIGIASLICAIIILKTSKYAAKVKFTKIISIVLIGISSLLLIFGLINFLYLFGVSFAYFIVLLDWILLAYCVIGLISLAGFISICIVDYVNTKEILNN